jgi:hypothetical protein
MQRYITIAHQMVEAVASLHVPAVFKKADRLGASRKPFTVCSRRL